MPDLVLAVALSRKAGDRQPTVSGQQGVSSGKVGLEKQLHPQKAHKDSHPEGQTAGQPASYLGSLPDAVVALVAQFSKQHHGHPLLRVSRSCRDAVLSSCTIIEFCTHPQQQAPKRQHASKAFSPAAHAMLLHRACCQAPPGLQLKLNLWKHSDSLPHLLQPGIDCGGWRNVTKLEVVVIADSAHLISSAFPALTKLELNHVDLENGELFSMLAAQAPCPLTFLMLHGCNIKDTAVEVAAAALARLPSLRACHVSGHGGTVSLCIASQLTALTHLAGGLEADVPPADTQLVKAVSRNKGLQSLGVRITRLGVRITRSFSPSVQMLHCLLDSCANLTQLDLSSQDVNDQGLDILLQHGTNVMDLTLGDVHVNRSWADSTCRWQRLMLEDVHGVLAGLAYLPLRSVQRLGTVDNDGRLHLPLNPSSDLVPLLQQAVSNLKACPAWQQQPAARILLYTLPWWTYGFPYEQKPQLFSALSPLGGPHLQHLGISMNTDFGQQEVQVLSRSIGSSLRSLSLRRGVIKPSFWPALSQYLPHLKELGLMHKVEVNSMGVTAYLRTLARTFTLHVGPGVLADHTVSHLTHQLQGVSVQQEYPADCCDFRDMDGQEADWEEENREVESEDSDDDNDEELHEGEEEMVHSE